MKTESNIFTFFSQSGIYVLGGILQRSVGFFLLPLYTSFLTPEDYGIAGLISVSISLLLPVGIMGISTSLMIEYYHSDSEKEKKSIVSTAIVISSLTSIFISTILFLSSRIISNILFSSSNWTYCLQLASISFLFSCISSVGFSFLRTRQQPIRFRSLSIASAVISALLNVLFIAHLGHGVAGFFEASVLTGLFQTGLLSFWIIKYVERSKIKKSIAISLLKLGFPDIPIRLSGWALTSANRYLLAIFASIAEVGIFNLAFRISSILELLFISIMTLAFDPFVLSHMRDDNFSDIYKRLVSYIMMFGVFLVCLLGVTSNEIIHLMARKKEFWPAYRSVGILALALLLYGFYMTYRPILGVLKKPSLAIPGMIVAAGVNAGLNYIFVPLWGAVGSALALAIAYLVTIVQIHYVISRHHQFAMPWVRLIRIFLAGAICYATSCFLPEWKPIIKLLAKICMISMSFPILLSILGGIDDAEKKAIHKRIGKYKFANAAIAILFSLDLRKAFR